MISSRSAGEEQGKFFLNVFVEGIDPRTPEWRAEVERLLRGEMIDGLDYIESEVEPVPSSGVDSDG